MIIKNTKCECFISELRRILMLFVILMLCGISGQAIAGISGVHSFDNDCNSGGHGTNGYQDARTHSITAGQCTLSTAVYVPHSGQYKVKAIVTDGWGGLRKTTTTTSAYLDEAKSLAEQNVTVSGTTVTYSVPSHGDYYYCRNIVDESNNEYALPGMMGTATICNLGAPLLKPTPPIIPTSCKINDGAALSVDLKTVDRSALPTVPGTGAIRHFPVDVECTGGIDVSVSMKFSYTPISVSGKQVIQSSSNGLGVAVIYNGQAISTTDATQVDFISGTNTLDLGFQAVRDPAVEVADIPTGAFTASAVMVMTQR